MLIIISATLLKHKIAIDYCLVTKLRILVLYVFDIGCIKRNVIFDTEQNNFLQ